MPYISIIANQLLVTPFDDKSSIKQDKLTPEEFCKKCYSYPMFEQKVQGEMPREITNEDNDSPINYDEIKNEKYRQEVSYRNFILWLENFSDNKVYTINGNAGTGKTTFINYKKYTDRENKWIILDINIAKSYEEWVSDIRTDVSCFEQAMSKVYASIMNNIYKLIFEGLDENRDYSIEVIYSNLEKITSNYNTRYKGKYPSGRKLFDEICKVVISNEGIFEKVEEVAQLFRKFVSGEVGVDGKGITEVLNIFLLSLRCLSDCPDEKYIIVFDNFERFITENELYNKDIDKVRVLLNDYMKGINRDVNIHKNHFKFVMTIRDSTARMCGVRLHASDSEACNLDIGKWYDAKEIICLKKKWYDENQLSIENSDVVEQIIGDERECLDKTVTGLKLFIDPLFNDNKRLIIDFVGSMVELPSNANNIKIYKKLWDEDTSQSRFAARSIIRGMILNELKEEKRDKLFEHLKTYSGQNGNNGIGDARKILTILYNNIQKGNANEMSLTTVFSELFRSPNAEKAWKEEIKTEGRKSISEILFYMNSYNRRKDDWIQFIDIQFKKNNCNIIIENPDQLEQLLNQNLDNFTIHLMPAGKAYLMYIVASFEFFSVRYVKKYSPLFTLIPTPQEIMRYHYKELQCYKTIECVTRYAKKCIYILRNRREDTIKLYINNSDEGKKHAKRIIDSHKSYIDLFVKYIKNKYCESDVFSDGIRKQYMILCNEISYLKNIYEDYENRISRG